MSKPSDKLTMVAIADRIEEAAYEKAVEVVLTKIVPNLRREDLEARVHEILGGYSPTG